MIIAVDFDGTIVENAYPEVGKAIPFAFETLKILQAEGYRLVLWTCREDKTLQDAVDFCAENGLQFYAVNRNYPEEDERIPRKLTADLFIDDRNIGGIPDWGVVYKLVKLHDKGITSYDEMISRTDHERHLSRKKRNWLIRLGEAWERWKNS